MTAIKHKPTARRKAVRPNVKVRPRELCAELNVGLHSDVIQTLF